MSAFLYEEALKKYGPQKAIQLVYSGNDGQFFFENLKQSLSIDESNFHDTILQLIDEKT